MRVLQIINSLGTGGAEKLLLDTIPLYRKAGIEMDILLFWNNNHQFVNALKELDICNVIVLQESENYKDIYSLSHILKLRKHLKNYDIAHVHLFPAQYFTVLANILIGGKCKLIFTEHNTTNRRIQKSYFQFIERFIYSHYEKLVCISDEISDIYKKYLPAFENKFTIINNGVNLETITKANPISRSDIQPSVKNSDKLLLQVSAFRPQKDQKTLIKAMGLLPDDVVLVLVGDGETRQECENLVAEMSLEKRVFFVGQRMDIPRLLKTADLILLSSNYEGLSLSSIEGMASGRAFVASDVPGLSEIVSGAGILFECSNPKDLANRIQELLENEELYNQTVANCQLRAQQYDIQLMIQKHIALYKSV
ncbi:hypothetical protein FLJC2902T_19650 [Flavobacterium limnosediminis JC2902]|uniref:Glycosyltransferase n=1 Tax=Flavobacterium limnosediminis JC2902 TaxID=1341181 RepID=V6SM01_9FLAO|nr:glycosyltransferase [Flavobacterium limnosediminis]ESU27262.1 hypothetical protein FLJC2902T_19650 [Flavobacterium limnosediminis JC2902]